MRNGVCKKELGGVRGAKGIRGTRGEGGGMDEWGEEWSRGRRSRSRSERKTGRNGRSERTNGRGERSNNKIQLKASRPGDKEQSMIRVRVRVQRPQRAWLGIELGLSAYEEQIVLEIEGVVEKEREDAQEGGTGFDPRCRSPQLHAT